MTEGESFPLQRRTAPERGKKRGSERRPEGPRQEWNQGRQLSTYQSVRTITRSTVDSMRLSLKATGTARPGRRCRSAFPGSETVCRFSRGRFAETPARKAG